MLIHTLICSQTWYFVVAGSPVGTQLKEITERHWCREDFDNLVSLLNPVLLNLFFLRKVLSSFKWNCWLKSLRHKQSFCLYNHKINFNSCFSLSSNDQFNSINWNQLTYDKAHNSINYKITSKINIPTVPRTSSIISDSISTAHLLHSSLQPPRHPLNPIGM